jgi:hypothetical protein
MSETSSEEDVRSRAERLALRRREYLTELLASTCKHLHTPEACEWCVLEQLNTSGPEVAVKHG